MPLSARHCLAIVKKKIVEVTTFISITVVNDASFSCNADRRHAWIQANKQFYARLYLFIQMQGASVFMLPQPLQGACRIPAESHRKEGTAPASPDLSGSTTGITPCQQRLARQIQTSPQERPHQGQLAGFSSLPGLQRRPNSGKCVHSTLPHCPRFRIHWPFPWQPCPGVRSS